MNIAGGKGGRNKVDRRKEGKKREGRGIGGGKRNSRPAKRPLCLYFDFMKSAVPLLLLSFLPSSVIAVTVYTTPPGSRPSSLALPSPAISHCSATELCALCLPQLRNYFRAFE